MKRTHYVATGAILTLLVICFAVGFVSKKVLGQTESKPKIDKKSERKPKIDKKLEWKPSYFPLSSANSKIKLKLDDLSQETDWILGVEIVDGAKKDEIAIGQIEWETIEKSPTLVNAKIPISITDANFDSLNTPEGLTRLSGMNDSEKTFIIHLKITPKTAISLSRGEQKLVDNVEARNFVILNGKEIDSSSQMKTLFLRMMKTKLFADSTLLEGREIQ